jgi:transposase
VRDRQSEREECRKRGSCIDPHGFDAGKLIKGKKRHVLVDTLGLVLHALVTAADVQDRDGGVLLLSTLFGQFPFLRKLFADSAYTGPVFRDGAANAMRSLVAEIVIRTDRAKGFVVEPKRWIVERSIACLNRCRRLAKAGKTAIATRSPSSASPRSASCSEGSVTLHEVFGRSLSHRRRVPSSQTAT